jgi:hypothetical protein
MGDVAVDIKNWRLADTNGKPRQKWGALTARWGRASGVIINPMLSRRSSSAA